MNQKKLEKELVKGGWCICEGKKPHIHLTKCILNMVSDKQNPTSENQDRNASIDPEGRQFGKT